MVMVQHGTISVAVKQVTRRHIKAASTVTRLGAAPTSTLTISMYGQPLPLRVASYKTQANKRHAQGGTACLLVLKNRHHFKHLKGASSELESIAAHPTEPPNERANTFCITVPVLHFL